MNWGVRRLGPWVVVCIASACTFHASCGNRLNGKKLTKALSAFAKQRLGVEPDRVECPDDIPLRSGHEFDCTVHVGDLAAPVHVVQTDDSGSVTFGFSQAIVTAETVQAGLVDRLKSATGVDAAVDCGQRFRLAEPGASFECVATNPQGQKLAIPVTVVDKDGKLRFGTPRPVR